MLKTIVIALIPAFNAPTAPTQPEETKPLADLETCPSECQVQLDTCYQRAIKQEDSDLEQEAIEACGEEFTTCCSDE